MGLLEIGLKVAKEAGAMLEKRIGTEFSVEEKSSSFDLVTEMDKASEKFITEKILEMFQDHKVFGEESIHQSGRNIDDFLKGLKEEPFVWILDPIDGTTNYVHQLPNYTISIALLCYGEAKIGIIYNPSNDELFWAENGNGAYLNGQKLEVSKTKELSESLLATGFPTNIEHDRFMVLKGIQELGPLSRNIRVFGSAALHCAYVAAGRIHAFWEPGLNIWDVAAGTLLVKEAGGTVSEMDGSLYELASRTYLCSNGVIDLEVIKHLKKAIAETIA